MILDPVLRLVGQGYAKLPEPVLRRLAGTPLKNERGDSLDLHAQALAKVWGRAAESLEFEALRRRYEYFAGMADVPGPGMYRVVERTAPGPEGPIPLRIFQPNRETRNRPIMLYFHGGGFCVGSNNTADGLCRYLAHKLDWLVVSAEYRLAPEHPYPAAVDDALTAYRWISEHARSLGAHDEWIVVGGDSAGGNLTAIVAQQATQRPGWTSPSLQVLVYPLLDMRDEARALRATKQIPGLTPAVLDRMEQAYAAAGEDLLASPMARESVGDLPPAVIVSAGFDPLLEENEAYAKRLEQADVPVFALHFPQLPHGFWSLGGVLPSARQAIDEIANALTDRRRAPFRTRLQSAD